jgi:hypothetical protein
MTALPPSLPPARRNVVRYTVNWERAARVLERSPDQWVLLAANVPAEHITRLRAGKVAPLAHLHPHVQFQLSESRRSRRSGRWVGRLWAYYTPGRESAHAIRARLRHAADITASELSPAYPPIPKIADL